MKCGYTPTHTIRVVVVGQTPPPWHGQGIMIEALLKGEYEGVRLHHVRMGFSSSLAEVGRPSLRKILELARLIIAIWRARITFGGDVLYYPPAGPDLVPLVRDVVLLLLTRPLFRRTVLHFHAGGVSNLVRRIPPPFRWLAQLAYGRANPAIVLSTLNPPDGVRLRAKRQVVVPHGIEDIATRSSRQTAVIHTPTILFVGAVREDKGVLALLEACRVLADREIPFLCRIVGPVHPAGFETRCREFVTDEGLEDMVAFPGLLTGAAKWAEYRAADVFTFPTWYEVETFGVVVLEAMQFGLPVVATRWRGIPDIVEEGRTGLLIPPRDPAALAAALERLLLDGSLRARMGEQGRTRYEDQFTLMIWRARMEAILAGNEEVPPASPLD